MSSALVLSKNSNGVPLAHRLGSEGCVTKLLFDNQQYNSILLGLQNPVVIPSLRMLEQYDLIIDTGTKSSDSVISEGHTILGGGPFGRRLDEDEVYRARVLKLVPQLQKALPTTSLNLFTTGWFDSEKFSFFTNSISYDRLCESHKGRVVPSMGRVTTSCPPRAEFDGLVPLLQKLNYLGPVSIALDHSWISTTLLPIEVFELYKSKSFDLLWALKTKQPVQLRDETSVLYKLVLDTPHTAKAIEVEREAFPHVCYQECDGNGVACGSDVCVVTARADKIFEARRRATRTIRRIVRTQDIQYRCDIGSDIELVTSLFQKEVSNGHTAEKAVCAS